MHRMPCSRNTSSSEVVCPGSEYTRCHVDVSDCTAVIWFDQTDGCFVLDEKDSSGNCIYTFVPHSCCSIDCPSGRSLVYQRRAG